MLAGVEVGMPILVMGLVALTAFAVIGILLFSAGILERRQRSHEDEEAKLTGRSV